jgi:hypothetical protein
MKTLKQQILELDNKEREAKILLTLQQISSKLNYISRHIKKIIKERK